MKTLNLYQAADFLRMNPEVLRRKVRNGEIPGKKPGKQWVFVDQQLADWVGTCYANKLQAPQVDEETKLCLSTNAVKRGGYISIPPTDKGYANLLKLKTDKRRKSSTIG